MEQVRAYWGFDSFRPMQDRAIRATLAGRDSVVVLSTGGGKSLCYQVPPLVTGQATVVVSPLISLMKDQVDGLRACGYPAAAIHSGMSGAENTETIRALQAGRCRLLFVSPERLLTSWFLDIVDRLDVHSFAIDEAHCVSEWGHDFRPEYRSLATLKKRFPSASVHAYTATATERVRKDIISQLQLDDPEILVGTFDRPNLTYRVVPRCNIDAQVVDVVKRHADEGTIVYCLSRKDTESLAATLQAAGVDARPYHAGLNPNDRRRTQDAFASEKLNVVTATVAFGMGIDRSNVRCVIHATMPKSVENYQQETGRAGRDGLEAECVLFYSASDAMRWQSLISRNATGSPESERVIANQTSLIEQMRRYCTTLTCRHRALSEYFGQSNAEKDCQACDVCLDDTADVEDATETAQKILSCVARIQRMGGINYGVGYVTDVLLGAATQSIRQRGHDQLSTYSLLRNTPKKTLTNLIYQLVDQGLLARTTGDRPVLELNDASWEVLRSTRTVRVVLPKQEPIKESRSSTASWDGVDRGLFEHLRKIRREMAENSGLPAYTIFSDRTLRDLARRRPTTLTHFSDTHGIGNAKLKRFGDRFCGEISSYCDDKDVPTDIEISPANRRSRRLPSPDTAPAIDRPKKISETKQRAIDLFATGASVADVMRAVGRARSTVTNYLCAFIEITQPNTITTWVNQDTYAAVAGAASEVGFDRLRPIYEHLDQRVSYDDIRLVLTHLGTDDA